MRLSSVRRLVAAIVWAAAAATVALLPGIGPMLDHHYAGRQPGHDHVHMGALFPDHPHAHEISHDHDHHHSGAPAPGGEEGRGGLVLVASYSGATAGHAYVAGSASQTELSFPGANDAPNSYAHGDAALREQSFVTPPTQPPQV